MRVLDLFSGLGGFSEPFRDRGHEVITLDIDSRFKPDIVADVRKIRYPSLPPLDRPFDVFLASPPCTGFSRAQSFNQWPPPRELVEEGLGLVAATFELVAIMRPLFWVIENPLGYLRQLITPPVQTIHLCNFGATWQKPTDLWGRFPELDNPWPCASHEAATLGDTSKGQTKGYGGLWATRDPALRAKLPYGLGEELCKRMEAKIEVMV